MTVWLVCLTVGMFTLTYLSLLLGKYVQSLSLNAECIMKAEVPGEEGFLWVVLISRVGMIA